MDKKLTRTFICIEFPDEIIKEVARVQELLEKTKFQGKLTELENLHLTIKFLGSICENKLEEVKKRLSKIKFSPMKLKLGKIGLFYLLGKPRMAWIKIEGKEIYDLQERIDKELGDLFEIEKRFMSHLTIARFKYIKDKKGFLEHINSVHVSPVSFDVSEFKLKKSDLKPLGPVYSDILVCKSD